MGLATQEGKRMKTNMWKCPNCDGYYSVVIYKCPRCNVIQPSHLNDTRPNTNTNTNTNKWEYRVLTVCSLSNIDNTLNVYGKEGWEVFQVDMDAKRFFMRRFII